jgi:hypothetical protein
MQATPEERQVLEAEAGRFLAFAQARIEACR